MARARDKGNRISSDYRTAPVGPRIRSKHGNLLNYFIHDRRDLSPAYVRECEKFLKKLKKKKELKRPSAQASGRVGPIVFKLNHHPQPPSKYIGLSGFCQEVYLHKSKINLLQAPGLWDILGYY